MSRPTKSYRTAPQRSVLVKSGTRLIWNSAISN